MSQYEIATLLASLVDATEKPAVLRDAGGTVTHPNAAYLHTFGQPTAQTLQAHLGDLDNTLGATDRTALQTRRSCAADAVTMANGKAMPVRLETTPLYTNGMGSALVGMLTTVLPLEQYLALEIQYARQIAGSPIDNLWILSESLRVLSALGDSDSLASTGTGLHVQDLVHTGQREMVLHRFAEARDSHGQVIIGEVTGRRRTGLRRVIMRIVYRHGEGGTGRYYAATRMIGPAGEQIIDRLMLAYGVITVAALSRAMGVTPSAISRRKQSDDVPPSWVVDCFRRTGISADWLLTGRGAPKRADRE